VQSVILSVCRVIADFMAGNIELLEPIERG